MTDQPEALRLVFWLESDYYDDVRITAASAELRRLHAECEALRAALEQAMPQLIGRPYLDARAALKEAK